MKKIVILIAASLLFCGCHIYKKYEQVESVPDNLYGHSDFVTNADTTKNFSDLGVIKDEISLQISISGILLHHAEERFNSTVKKSAPVHFRTCKETVELVLASVDEWSKLMME